MNPLRVARPDGPTGRALQQLRAHGSMERGPLAAALDMTDDELDAQLRYAVRMGAIVRTEDEAGVRYALPAGEQPEAPPPAAPAPAPQAAPPAPAPDPAPETGRREGAGARVSRNRERARPAVEVRAGTPVPPDLLQIRQFKAPSAAANEEPMTPAELGAIVGEAAKTSGVDLDLNTIGMNAARELLSAAARVLEVVDMDVGLMESGRMVLQLDGVIYVLPPDKSARLFAYLDGRELPRA